MYFMSKSVHWSFWRSIEYLIGEYPNLSVFKGIMGFLNSSLIVL